MRGPDQDAHDAILRMCRKGAEGFKTRGQWVMRLDVNPQGTRNPNAPRVPCAVLDVGRTEHDPKTFHTRPRILASGEDWNEVKAALISAGEMS